MPLHLPSRRPAMRIDASLAIVNIVLLLVFFFIIAGQDSQPAAGFALPDTRALPRDRLPSPILSVAADGGWMLDDQPVTPELLPVAMQSHPGGVLYLMIPRDAPASLLIATLNRVELRPYEVRLVTLHEQSRE